MKIISWNVNGLRAVYKRNFLGWLRKSGADIICLQEIKIQEDKLPIDLLKPKGFHAFFNFAVKRGYSGVAVYTKTKPLSVERKLGFKRFDQEGRMLKLDFPAFSLINLYLPHGGRQKENLKYKLEVYKRISNFLRKIRNKPLVIIGDFNIAHNEIDLARPKDNRNNIMFTLEERKQIDKIVGLGFADTFRKFHKEGGWYTWWPYRLNTRERNIGWRIDYAFASKYLSLKIKDAFILKNVKGSDHCPTGISL